MFLEKIWFAYATVLYSHRGRRISNLLFVSDDPTGFQRYLRIDKEIFFVTGRSNPSAYSEKGHKYEDCRQSRGEVITLRFLATGLLCRIWIRVVHGPGRCLPSGPQATWKE